LLTNMRFATCACLWMSFISIGPLGAAATDISNPTFGQTNISHMELAHSTVSRQQFMTAKATQKDNYVLLMFDEIVMARDEETGIENYVHTLIPDESKPRILEVGFGMGISASYIHKVGCSSHTIVEANADVMKSLVDWRINMTKSSACLVTPIFGFWEDVLTQLSTGMYGGIMYDPHPSTATLPFLREARRLLRVGGKLVFFLSLYHNSSVPSTWRKTRDKLKLAGWQDIEIGKPKLFHGEVMADCGHKYTQPGPTKECPFRPITYIIPEIVRKRDPPQPQQHREL